MILRLMIVAMVGVVWLWATVRMHRSVCETFPAENPFERAWLWSVAGLVSAGVTGAAAMLAGSAALWVVSG